MANGRNPEKPKRRRTLGPLSAAAAMTAALIVMLVPSSALSLAWTGQTGAKPDLSVNRSLIAPTAAQKQLVTRLGARASWNRYGTPSSLLKLNGYLATGLSGTPVEAAKTFLAANKALYKLSSTDNLQLVNDVTLTGTNAHAILFAQKFGSLVADWNGLLAVGVVDGKVAYVSSSAAGDQPVTGTVKLSATDAWSVAARNAGVASSGSFGAPTQKDGWTYFDVPGLTDAAHATTVTTFDLKPTLPSLPALPGSAPTAGAGSTSGATTPTVDRAALLAGLQAKIRPVLGSATPTAQASSPVAAGVHQAAKLVAFPTVKDGVRPAWLVNVVDLRKATPSAYQYMIDADSGAVLLRHDAVQEVAQASAQPAYTFTGAYAPPACGPVHAFAVDSGAKSLAAAASAANPTNDIIFKVLDPSGTIVGASDTATSPEAVVYQDPQGRDLATGNWGLQVCPYTGPSLQPPLPNQTAPYTYVAAVSVTNAAPSAPAVPRPKPPTLVTNNPRWAFFPSFPGIDYTTTPQSEGCWQNANDGIHQPADCAQTFASSYSPFGWDVIPRTNQSTLTTRGNNAFTAEDWLSPLTPAEQRSPVSADRYYDRSGPGGNFVWTNAWNQSGCNPAVLADPTHNNGDIDAAATNLFVMHNRMHDFAYALGFTEATYNAQLDNLDNGNQSTGPYPYGREGDPELGNAQAGAISGGQPSLEGRDNANQITLNDGTPPITNQYLWQPIASAFYSPCTDGSFDLSVAGHEYTHLISNRMVGGPDASLSSFQGGAMGEAWSDLDALEYLHEYGLAGARGEEPWSLGAYVTGNKEKGIRDYALDKNPLNFSDVGFDTTGPEVHADGEIWNGVNFEVRSALVQRYGEGDTATNISCAKGETPVAQCPGGRRWIQLVYDAWLLEQADLSMVDARDAMLAADLMRFGGADETDLWHAFAHRGLGTGASSDTGEDTDPTPSFASPKEDNAAVSFVTVAKDGSNAGHAVPANVYVGDYQARATAAADTDPGTALGNTAALVPGSYDFVVQAPGYGLVKFTRTLAAGASTLTIALPTNWASAASDATTAGDGVNQGKLIDDSETTNWASLSGAVAGKQVTVTLAGRHVLTAARVSALLHPSSCAGTAEEQGNCVGDTGNDPDNTAQNRFTALRSFTIQACDSSVRNCSLATSWVTAVDSPADAFPSVRPRPAAPDLILRTFDVSGVPATMVRLVVKTNQCTGGPDFQGDQDSDPSNNSDCVSTANATKVRAAELEVVSSSPTITSSTGTTTLAVVRTSTAQTGAPTSAAASGNAASTSAAASAVVGRSPAASEAKGGVLAVQKTFSRLTARGSLHARSSRMLVTFSLDVSAGKRGSLLYRDPSRRLELRSTRILTVLVDRAQRRATVTGRARANGRPVRFTLRLTDRAGTNVFAIQLSNGYVLSGSLVQGSVSLL